MGKLNRLLVALLVLQVAVFVLVKLWPQSNDVVKPHAIFSFKAADVQGLEIADNGGFDGKKNRVVLAKEQGKWLLKSGGDYPLLALKVDELLGKLVALKVESPVSTRAAHHRQLEVAKEHFQRDVTVKLGGGKKVRFWLGSSPGLKKVHLRLEGQQAVYAASPLASWDVGATASSWIDTTYFKVERDHIASFVLQNKHGKIGIKREGNSWVPVDGDGPLDQTEVDSLVSTLSMVTMRAPVGRQVLAAQGLAQPQALLVVHTRKPNAASKPTSPNSQSSSSQPASAPTSLATTQPALQVARLRIGAKVGKDGTAYYAQRDGSPFVVTIDSSTADALLGKKLGDLKPKPKQAAPPAPPAPTAP